VSIQPSMPHMCLPHTVTACTVLCCAVLCCAMCCVVLCCEKCCAVLSPGVCCGWVPLLKTSCPRMQQVGTACPVDAAVQNMCGYMSRKLRKSYVFGDCINRVSWLECMKCRINMSTCDTGSTYMHKFPRCIQDLGLCTVVVGPVNTPKIVWPMHASAFPHSTQLVVRVDDAASNKIINHWALLHALGIVHMISLTGCAQHYASC